MEEVSPIIPPLAHQLEEAEMLLKEVVEVEEVEVEKAEAAEGELLLLQQERKLPRPQPNQ